VGDRAASRILLAINPLYGIEILIHFPWRGFVMLGAVFLAVTGAETLYADMGHFGRRALRRAWLGLVLPALVLNYFGQEPCCSATRSPRKPLLQALPAWGLYPLVALASIATIIASQAVISGAFSITRQAIQLGYLPRPKSAHTSEDRDRAGLCAADQHRPVDRDRRPHSRLPVVGQSGRRPTASRSAA